MNFFNSLKICAALNIKSLLPEEILEIFSNIKYANKFTIIPTAFASSINLRIRRNTICMFRFQLPQE